MHEKIKYYIFLLLSFISFFILFWNRDFFFHNELKYVDIVTDALSKGNLFSFFNQGEIYADKPPLYFWLFMCGKAMIGQIAPICAGVFNIIATAGILIVMNKISVYAIKSKNISKLTEMKRIIKSEKVLIFAENKDIKNGKFKDIINQLDVVWESYLFTIFCSRDSLKKINITNSISRSKK